MSECCKEELKEIEASPQLMKFFKNMFEIKQYVKEKYELTKNEDFNVIYNMMDNVLKNKEECNV